MHGMSLGAVVFAVSLDMVSMGPPGKDCLWRLENTGFSSACKQCFSAQRARHCAHDRDFNRTSLPQDCVRSRLLRRNVKACCHRAKIRHSESRARRLLTARAGQLSMTLCQLRSHRTQLPRALVLCCATTKGLALTVTRMHGVGPLEL